MDRFEIEVKKKLLDMGKNQKWLVEVLQRYNTGVRVDSCTVSQAISGKSYKTLRSAIAVVLGIKNEE